MFLAASLRASWYPITLNTPSPRDENSPDDGVVISSMPKPSIVESSPRSENTFSTAFRISVA